MSLLWLRLAAAVYFGFFQLSTLVPRVTSQHALSSLNNSHLRHKLGEVPDVHCCSPLASDMVVLLWTTRLLHLDLQST